MMRIMQVNTEDQGGGAARIAQLLHHGYQAAGHQSWLAVGRKQSHDPHVLAIDHEAARPILPRIMRRLAHDLRVKDYAIKGTWRLAQWLERQAEPQRYRDLQAGLEDMAFPGSQRVDQLAPSAIDLLHLHNLHGGYFDLRALPDLTQRVPTVITLHDAWMLAGHCAHPLDCERWKSGCGACPHLDLYVSLQADGSAENYRRKAAIYEKSRLFVCSPARWLVERAKASMLAPAIVDSTVIPNGVDLELFSPGDMCEARKALDLPDHAYVLLFAARGIRTQPWKDYPTLRQAFEMLAKQLPHRRIILLALGESGTSESVGLSELRFVPFEGRAEDVVTYYRAADVYVHAARADTFPNTVMEAMACGKPVVASEVGGISEQIDNGLSGFLTPAGDAHAMSWRLSLLLRNADLRRTVGHQAAISARRRFCSKVQVQRYLDWFAHILQHKSQRKQAA